MINASASWALRASFVGILGLLGAVACEDMNRPMAVPHSEPRNTCFSDVECASGKKCIKGPQEIRGWCTDPRELVETNEGASDGGTAPAPPSSAPADGGSTAPAPGEVKL